MVYIVKANDDYPHDCIAEYINGDLEPSELSTGCNLPEDVELNFSIEAKLKKISSYDIVVANCHALLVSKNAVGLLRREMPCGDVQIVPVTIKAKDGYLQEYCLLHVLKIADVIDREKSIIVYFRNTNHILGFDELHFKSDYESEFLIARVDGYLPLTVVSNDFVELFGDVFTESRLGFIHPEEFFP